MLDVRQHEGVARRDETKIQGQDAQDRGGEGDPPAELGRRHRDAEHVQHDHVGQPQPIEHDITGQGRQGDQDDDDPQAAETGMARQEGAGHEFGGLVMEVYAILIRHELLRYAR